MSLHGDPQSEPNLAIRSRAEALADERPSRKPLAIEFYKADSAAVWG
ncbi:MAG TPA: hypothetical protein VEB65_11245 [Solirubrobacterales bacterium]|nr:hypothetical protein [Solirubrobacterales bacterium]